ncbi:SusE domain-containing protein [Flavobacterium sp. P4023]|uniref:SusE domain-containing protein n=1 Tax=Flavobacterium flabelliforme TaxID=2816119 RepID=A0ABS5CWA6_9FLAO|nr:SusE domain-containing protein [Flavobacterium flabelliforme]MBP4142907.1 SusE domain-containing protein [Flavobacterium flabelliforme]
MKNINKLLVAFLSIAAISCTDDIQDTNREAVAGVKAPVLLSPTGDFNIVLSKATEKDVATTFVWDDAAYAGTPTVVNYTIEIAKAGTKFAAPIVVTTTTSRFKAITVGELNSALVNGGFVEKQENLVDIRVKSSIGATSSVAQFSNFFTIKVTSYRTPLASSLWLVGAATPGGWSWDDDAETELPLVIGQTNVYQVAVMLNGGEAFRIFLGNNFTSNGNWDASRSYAFYANAGYTITPELVNANDGDFNFKYTGPTGMRVLKIDNAAKTITLE